MKKPNITPGDMKNMDRNEIKKALYKEKPDARLSHIRKGIAYYYSDLIQCRVRFEVPVSDMGDADFGVSLDAKSLIRWLIWN